MKPTLTLFIKDHRIKEEPLDFRGMHSHHQRQVHIGQTAKRIMELYEKDLMLGSWEIVILGSESRSGSVNLGHYGKMADTVFVERMRYEMEFLTD